MRISDWSSDVCSSDLLLAVHHPFVAVMFGSGLDAREVRARAGFGEQLAPDLAGDDPGQEAELLLRGAVGDDGRSGQVLGDAARGWGHPGIAAEIGRAACRERVGK